MNWNKWTHLVHEKKVALNGPMVQEKATEFAGVMGITDFQASGVWLDSFKKRENLFVSFYLGRSVSLSVCLSVYLFVCVCLSLFLSVSVFLSFCLSVLLTFSLCMKNSHLATADFANNGKI